MLTRPARRDYAISVMQQQPLLAMQIEDIRAPRRAELLFLAEGWASIPLTKSARRRRMPSLSGQGSFARSGARRLFPRRRSRWHKTHDLMPPIIRDFCRDIARGVPVVAPPSRRQIHELRCAAAGLL